MTVAAETPSVAGRLGRLTLLFLAHAVGTANITLVLAMAPAIEEALGLGHAGFGLMVSSYYCALLILALPAGWLADRLGIRAMLVTAHLLLAAGMAVFASASGLPVAVLGLMLCGSGYALINPATARGVLAWFPMRGRATAMGAKQTGVPAGGVIAALFVATGQAGWRELAMAVAAVTLLIGIGFLALRSARFARAGVAPTRLVDTRSVLVMPRLALFNAAACLYAGTPAAFFAYLVLFARDALAAPAAAASLCLAAAHVASAVGRIGWGIISDVLAHDGRIVSLVICGIAAIAGLALLLPVPALGGIALLALAAALLGLTLGGYAGLTQTAAAEAVEPRSAGASIGYNMLLTSVGTMLGPVAFGVTVEWTGYAPAWGIMAAMLALGAGLFHASARYAAPASESKTRS